jgi:hypothetical protein
MHVFSVRVFLRKPPLLVCALYSGPVSSSYNRPDIVSNDRMVNE